MIRTGEVVSPVRKSPDQQECLPPLELVTILKHNKTMIGFDDTMPIGAMTIGDLKLLMHEILEIAAGQNATKRTTSSAKRYVYGIKGIEELFGCSHATAQHYKDHVIKEAVTQNGRKIIVDVDHAIELFGRRNNNGQ